MKRLILFAALLAPLLVLAYDSEPSYEDGYRYGQDASDISDCTAEFGSDDEAFDGCAEAISERGGEFHGYECTDDCSGHQAGRAVGKRDAAKRDMHQFAQCFVSLAWFIFLGGMIGGSFRVLRIENRKRAALEVENVKPRRVERRRSGINEQHIAVLHVRGHAVTAHAQHADPRQVAGQVLIGQPARYIQHFHDFKRARVHVCAWACRNVGVVVRQANISRANLAS